MKKQMIVGGLFSIVLLTTACSSKDEKFCECLKKGEELNKLTEQVWSGKLSKEQADSIKKMKVDQEKACADYQMMSGEEMLKRKAACE